MTGPRKGKLGGTSTIHRFPRAGIMRRKTIYLAVEEWDAIEEEQQERLQSATRIIRDAVRDHLGLPALDHASKL